MRKGSLSGYDAETGEESASFCPSVREFPENNSIPDP
jgi:hypothetical protein